MGDETDFGLCQSWALIVASSGEGRAERMWASWTWKDTIETPTESLDLVKRSDNV